MSSRIRSACLASEGSARAASSSPVASQPLSTEDRNGLTVSPESGKVRSFSPVAGSYQL